MDTAGSARATPATTALAGLASLAVAMGIGRFAFTPLLPMMQHDDGLSVSDGGWLAAANYAGYLAGALSAIAVRLRAVSAIRAALAVTALSTFAMAETTSFVAWLGWRTLAGIASAWVLVFTSSWALERLGALRRADLAGAIYAGVGIGIALAGLACLVLQMRGARAVEAWRWLGVMAAVATLGLWPLLDDGGSVPTPANDSRASARSYRSRLVLSYGLFGFGYIVPATFLPAMAKAIIPDPRAFGWVWPVFGVAAALSTLGSRRLSSRFGFRGLWMWATLAMAAGLALPLIVHGLGGLLVSALAVGGTFMVITMAGLQEARRISGSQARATMAAMTSAFAVGQIAGPVLVALLRGRSQAVPITLACACALLVASAALLARPPPHPELDSIAS